MALTIASRAATSRGVASRAVTPREAARRAGLRYADDREPGLTRRRAGKGFVFFTAAGRQVRDPRTLRRIRGLAIPPAWTQVWISPDAAGHIQATGRDARGRKQYLYHPNWRAVRDEAKFERVVTFGAVLPAVRAQLQSHLGQRGLTREKVLATAVSVLDLTHIRVGNDEYARENDSFGLTTMRCRHVRIQGDSVRFSFRGKSGVKHSISLRDRRLTRIIRSCQELPGQELFRFLDADGVARRIASDDVNAYLRQLAGMDVSAKDFRTFSGTILATRALLVCEPAANVTQARRNVIAAIDAVAKALGNTRAVCRKSYIHPQIFAAYEQGALAQAFAAAAQLDEEAFEARVIAFLRKTAATSDAVAIAC